MIRKMTAYFPLIISKSYKKEGEGVTTVLCEWVGRCLPICQESQAEVDKKREWNSSQPRAPDMHNVSFLLTNPSERLQHFSTASVVFPPENKRNFPTELLHLVWRSTHSDRGYRMDKQFRLKFYLSQPFLLKKEKVKILAPQHTQCFTTIITRGLSYPLFFFFFHPGDLISTFLLIFCLVVFFFFLFPQYTTLRNKHQLISVIYWNLRSLGLTTYHTARSSQIQMTTKCYYKSYKPCKTWSSLIFL